MGRYDHLIGKELATGSWSWDSDKALLYAVGVGAGLQDPLQELRFTTENILNAPYVFTQGPIVQEKYTNGVKFTIGLTLTP